MDTVIQTLNILNVGKSFSLRTMTNCVPIVNQVGPQHNTH